MYLWTRLSLEIPFHGPRILFGHPPFHGTTLYLTRCRPPSVRPWMFQKKKDLERNLKETTTSLSVQIFRNHRMFPSSSVNDEEIISDDVISYVDPSDGQDNGSWPIDSRTRKWCDATKHLSTTYPPWRSRRRPAGDLDGRGRARTGCAARHVLNPMTTRRRLAQLQRPWYAHHMFAHYDKNG